MAILIGCDSGSRDADIQSPQSDPSATATADSATADPATLVPSQPTPAPTAQVYEVSGEQLLAARLSRKQAADGWILLFDGHTLFGWDLVGTARWSIDQQMIQVDQGDPGRLLTSMPWNDFEIQLEYRITDPTSRASILLRSPLGSLSSNEYYEILLFDDEDGFSLGSIRGRQQATPSAPAASDDWQTLHVTVSGGEIAVQIDGATVCHYTDPSPVGPGRVGLRYVSGTVHFRDIRLRPTGLTALLDDELSLWKHYPEMPGSFKVDSSGTLQVTGGRTQLESIQRYDDFVLMAQYKFPSSTMNSGIFFRCIPAEEMMGYECQLSNQINGDNPLSPTDCGTGGIFRRQDARVVAGNSDDWSSVVLVVSGLSMAAWVEGVQVSQWYDDRPANENPRRGARVDAGTIMIQGHDPETQAELKTFLVSPL